MGENMYYVELHYLIRSLGEEAIQSVREMAIKGSPYSERIIFSPPARPRATI